MTIHIIDYFASKEFAGRKLMAIDFGVRKLGIAISDRGHMIGSPLATIKRRNIQQDFSALEKLINQKEAAALIIGMPYELDGSIGRSAKQAQSFADLLDKKLNMPISFFDERFTTRAASRAFTAAGMTGKQADQFDDKVAAAIILQTALDLSCKDPSDSPKRVEFGIRTLRACVNCPGIKGSALGFSANTVVPIFSLLSVC